jgi:hypothetical protein
MGKLLASFVFGSVARAQGDDQSDLDILAIVADGHGKVAERDVLVAIPPELQRFGPSISWYGLARVEEMFRNGDLFAWHLHHEAVPIFDPESLLLTLGEPAPYSSSSEDVAFFEALLSSIPSSLKAQPSNAVYELGLVYVCLRNIGMAASGKVAGRPNFSRYSPFELPGITPPPIARSQYDIAMTCRMAGQRGITPPVIMSPAEIVTLCASLQPWIAEIRRRLETDHESCAAAHPISGTR